MLGIVFAWLLSGCPAHLDIAIAQAVIESDLDPTAVSHVNGTLFCGLWQTTAHSKAECKRQQDVFVDYEIYRAELAKWDSYTHNLAMSLDSYACGWKGPENGCHNYSKRVLHLAKRIREKWL